MAKEKTLTIPVVLGKRLLRLTGNSALRKYINSQFGDGVPTNEVKKVEHKEVASDKEEKKITEPKAKSKNKIKP